METCTKCTQLAKYFRRKRGDILFACEDPEHLQSQGGAPNDWKFVDAAGGLLLTAARNAAATFKTMKK